MAFGSTPPAPPPNRYRTGCLAFAGLSAVLLAVIAFRTFYGGSSLDAAKAEAVELLTIQKSAWNAGDLSRFTATYRMHADLSLYSEGRKYTGWEQVNDRYRTMYPNGPRGQLDYQDVTAEPLAADAVVLRGAWTLATAEGARSGLFTILARRFPAPEGWKIVHDHMTVGEMR